MNAPRLPDAHIADAQHALRHVFLRDMVLQAAVGVHAFERTGAQRIRVNVDLAVEDEGARALSRAAPGRDELSRVVDYEVVADRVRAIVAAGHISLLETLAERLAEACLVDPRVRVVRVRVEKLDIFPDAASVGVEIERRNATALPLIPDAP
jgi:dihydroneopterin aldolase